MSPGISNGLVIVFFEEVSDGLAVRIKDRGFGSLAGIGRKAAAFQMPFNRFAVDAEFLGDPSARCGLAASMQ